MNVTSNHNFNTMFKLILNHYTVFFYTNIFIDEQLIFYKLLIITLVQEQVKTLTVKYNIEKYHKY